MANTPVDGMGLDDSVQHILQTTLNKKGLETSQAVLETPGKTDRMYVGPNQAIPIVFVPGIMGSPLIAKGEKNKNIFKKQGGWAWKPDDSKWSLRFGMLTPYERKVLLMPRDCRALDKEQDADQEILKNFLKNSDFPLEEAIRRGWGSVMISSYGNILQYLEYRLRFIFYQGKPHIGTYNAMPTKISAWGRVRGYRALSNEDLRKAAAWRFPVYAVGYNWMDSNGVAAEYLKKRIDAIRKDCRERLKLKCDRVIIVTHSMGGLVARMFAKRYPNDVLGIVHGEQPAIGAATAYARVRGGWEGHTPSAWVLGRTGAEVTSVFTAGSGPLELLPNHLYGNNWLTVEYKGNVLLSLPKNNNPYDEIYKVHDKWWRLVLQHPMVNTGEKDWRLKVAEEWGRYVVQLNRAHKFHVELGNFYHPKTYAHWGADDKQKAWHKVSWQIQGLREISSGLQAKQPSSEKIDAASLQRDQMAGWAEILDKSSAGDVWVRNAQGVGVIRRSDGNYYRAKLSSQDQTGDATVPAHSSRAPEPYVSFFAEMQGFEHQNSYKSLRVKAVTFYSVMAIAAQAPKMS